VAPPKRKSGGRVTPKGSRAGNTTSAPAQEGGAAGTSGRYTAPIPQSMRQSPSWVPVLMLVLLILGAVLIIARNLVFSGNNWLTLVGLGCIMGGLFTATKWR